MKGRLTNEKGNILPNTVFYVDPDDVKEDNFILKQKVAQQMPENDMMGRNLDLEDSINQLRENVKNQQNMLEEKIKEMEEKRQMHSQKSREGRELNMRDNPSFGRNGGVERENLIIGDISLDTPSERADLDNNRMLRNNQGPKPNNLEIIEANQRQHVGRLPQIERIPVEREDLAPSQPRAEQRDRREEDEAPVN